MCTPKVPFGKRKNIPIKKKGVPNPNRGVTLQSKGRHSQNEVEDFE